MGPTIEEARLSSLTNAPWPTWLFVLLVTACKVPKNMTCMRTNKEVLQLIKFSSHPNIKTDTIRRSIVEERLLGHEKKGEMCNTRMIRVLLGKGMGPNLLISSNSVVWCRDNN